MTRDEHLLLERAVDEVGVHITTWGESWEHAALATASVYARFRELRDERDRQTREESQPLGWWTTTRCRWCRAGRYLDDKCERCGDPHDDGLTRTSATARPFVLDVDPGSAGVFVEIFADRMALDGPVFPDTSDPWGAPSPSSLRVRLLARLDALAEMQRVTDLVERTGERLTYDDRGFGVLQHVATGAVARRLYLERQFGAFFRVIVGAGDRWLRQLRLTIDLELSPPVGSDPPEGWREVH